MPTNQLVQLVAAGAYQQAWQEAERLVGERGLSNGEQARIFRLACRASLGCRNLFLAARFGERALAAAESAQEPELLCKAQFDLGCIYAQIGDAHRAEQLLTAFLSCAASVPAGYESQPVAYYHLAFVFRQRRQWGAACTALNQAAELYGSLGQPREQVVSLLDLAWCHCMQEQPAEAEPPLEYAARYLNENPDPALTAELLCVRALWHRLRGEYAASASCCEAIFSDQREGATDRHLGTAAWVMGENALSLGHLGEARLFVNSALSHAVRANLPSLMNLANDLRRRLFGR